MTTAKEAQPQPAGQDPLKASVPGGPARASDPGWIASATEAERLRLFISSINDYAIFMLSPEGTVVSWNAGAQRFKGYSAEEIIGQHFSRFYTEEDRAADVPANALKLAREKGKFEAEGWRVRKDGSRFWASVVIDPIHGDHGELVGFAKVTRDITDRKNIAAELEQARQALFQTQKLDAIGKLTGGVVHDFNNVLNIITNGIALLQRRLGDPRDIHTLETMEKAAIQGTQLTRQLLSFARQQPVRPEPRDLNGLIGSFEAVLRQGSGNAILFELDLADSLPQALVDSAQFESALLNLVVNARDATPNGGRILLSTRAVELKERQLGTLSAGSYVAVSVQDTGAGMPPEVVARAVEPFFTTKEIGKGTGLGLSQALAMVQHSGGDMRIETRVGAGTTISMFFPALPPAAHPEEQPIRAQKVMIVDDQPEVLEVSSELFRLLGFEVLVAGSGQEALDAVQRTPNVQLILSDMLMPGMNGVQLALEARKLIPGIKVILSSGYIDPAIHNEVTLAGFHFLSKPYRIGDLVKKLREIG